MTHPCCVLRYFDGTAGLQRDDLKKQKLCAQFVPHSLTAEQWEQRVVHTKNLTILVLSWLESAHYFAFPKLKMELRGRPICNHKQHSNICNDETNSIPATDFSWAMHHLENHTNRCIAVNGDYFEWKNLFRLFWIFFWWFSKRSLKTYEMPHIHSSSITLSNQIGSETVPGKIR